MAKIHNIPSKSKAQHGFLRAVFRCKETGMCLSEKIKTTANSMSLIDIKDFLRTKKTELPERIMTFSNFLILKENQKKLGITQLSQNHPD